MAVAKRSRIVRYTIIELTMGISLTKGAYDLPIYLRTS
jgi:hypothetical protein